MASQARSALSSLPGAAGSPRAARFWFSARSASVCGTPAWLMHQVPHRCSPRTTSLAALCCASAIPVARPSVADRKDDAYVQVGPLRDASGWPPRMGPRDVRRLREHLGLSKQESRIRAGEAVAAQRRDRRLTLSAAARREGTTPSTVLTYFGAYYIYDHTPGRCGQLPGMAHRSR
jgi:hypothetical protein